jgi:fatty-acyl-CoA synthase
MGDWFPKQTLGSLPERAARRWGTREALHFQGRRWSFTELAQGVDRLARGLIALGVRSGERVALWMVNRPEFIEAMFAVMKIGAVLVPINTRLCTEDTAYVLRQSNSAVLVIADRSGPTDYLGMVSRLETPSGLSQHDFPHHPSGRSATLPRNLMAHVGERA